MADEALQTLLKTYYKVAFYICIFSLVTVLSIIALSLRKVPLSCYDQNSKVFISFMVLCFLFKLSGITIYLFF